MAKFQHLVATIARFEELYEADVWWRRNAARPRGGAPRVSNMRIQDLCRKMHSFYRKHKLNQLLQDMFQREKWPKLAQMPSETHDAYIRNRIELVPLSRIEGRIAAEGALPTARRALHRARRSVGGAALRYFRALEEGRQRIARLRAGNPGRVLGARRSRTQIRAGLCGETIKLETFACYILRPPETISCSDGLKYLIPPII